MNQFVLDSDFDPRIADWLEDDPDRAPDAVLQTVLAAFPSIPQRRAVRVSWRPSPMNRILLAGTAAATIVALAFGGSLLLTRQSDVGPSLAPISSARASTAPSATPLPTPGSSGIPELTQSVTSPSGDLTVRYPASWTELGSDVLTAPGAIGGEYRPDPNQPYLAFFAGSSAPLAEGESPEAWLARQDATCSDSAIPQELPIGGHAGTLLASGCSVLGGRTHYLAVVVVNGRGYTFHTDSRFSTVDGAWFRALLANVSFQP